MNKSILLTATIIFKNVNGAKLNFKLKIFINTQIIAQKDQLIVNIVKILLFQKKNLIMN